MLYYNTHLLYWRARALSYLGTPLVGVSCCMVLRLFRLAFKLVDSQIDRV